MNRKPIKMVLTDLDATLLKDDKTLSEYTLNVIQRLRDKDIKFVPATARAHRVLQRLQLLSILPHDSLILLNGGRIMKDEFVIFDQGLNPNQRDHVLKILCSHFPTERISVEMNDTMYVNHNIWEVDPYEQNYVLTDFSDLPQAISPRIIIGLKSLDDYPRLLDCLPDFMYAHNIEGTSLCRVLHRSVSKAGAIQHLCEMWGFDRSEIVCFGDDLNDIEMFEYCDHAVAVENACDEVKQRSTAITKSNNADGVAYWIEQNILNQA
ncbi:HAD family hydrolase [Erysipelothrix larvae]|nr:HAD family hydrolase [Erysipelothrix larvae]